MELAHDSPCDRGDSGALVVNADGQLLGINAKVTALHYLHVFGRDLLPNYRCTAISPDSEWLNQLILEDRVKSP